MIIFLSGLLALSTGADAAPVRRVLVTPLAHIKTDPADAKTLTQLFRVRVAQRSDLLLVSPEELGLIDKELERQLSGGCDEASCIVEFGGAAGAELLITGSLNRLGKLYILTVKLVDIETVTTLGSSMRRASSVESLSDELGGMIEELVGAGPTKAVRSNEAALGSHKADAAPPRFEEGEGAQRSPLAHAVEQLRQLPKRGRPVQDLLRLAADLRPCLKRWSAELNERGSTVELDGLVRLWARKGSLSTAVSRQAIFDRYRAMSRAERRQPMARHVISAVTYFELEPLWEEYLDMSIHAREAQVIKRQLRQRAEQLELLHNRYDELARLKDIEVSIAARVRRGLGHQVAANKLSRLSLPASLGRVGRRRMVRTLKVERARLHQLASTTFSQASARWRHFCSVSTQAGGSR